MEKDSFPRKLTVREFFKRFPDEETCLEHVVDVRFGLRHTCRKCGVVDATFHKLTDRKAYCCAHCGDHLYPCAGSIFEDTRTPLQTWFYAIYMFAVSRKGVPATELHRALGVTYKTAWRMARQIRSLMEKADNREAQFFPAISKSDETFVGGAARGYGKGPYASSNKTIVIGMKARGGRTITNAIPDVTTATLRGEAENHVAQGSTVSTDEAKAYSLVGRDGWNHIRVNHSEKDYAHYDYRAKDTASVNGVENFWKHFNASVRGTHVHVSRKHMDKYLGEFIYRANHRDAGNAMFDALIAAL